jgi:OmpA-OmpF porin, OOP family
MLNSAVKPFGKVAQCATVCRGMSRMNYVPCLLAIVCGVLLICPGTRAAAPLPTPTADVRGAKDHPLLKRYAGSIIVNYEQKAFDELALPLSRLQQTPQRDERNNRVFVAEKTLQLEGAYTRLLYLVPEGRSPLEVLRNYQEELRAGGGEILYECKNQECGGKLAGNEHGGNDQSLIMVLYPRRRVTEPHASLGHCVTATSGDLAEQRYTVGRLTRDGREAAVAVLTYTHPGYVNVECSTFTGRILALVLILERTAREQRMVTLKAEEMQSAIAATGRVALYGIYFDTDKTEISPESRPALEQIARLLKENSGLKVLIVGHTDNVGAFDYNLDLSRRRAEAVVSALKTAYGIDGARMRPAGVGMLAPIAPNDAEEGRAKNRRVELVKF